MDIFADLYRYYKRNNKGFTKKASEIESDLNKKFRLQLKVEGHEINLFEKVTGFKVTFDNLNAFFPNKSTIDYAESKQIKVRENLAEVELLLSPGIMLGSMFDLSDAIEKTNNPQLKRQLANNFLKTTFSIDAVAFIFYEKFGRLKSFSPYYDQILESIEAFYFGMDKLAITSLFPCAEGIIRSLSDQIGLNKNNTIDKKELLGIIKKIERNYIDKTFYKEFDWVPVDFKSVQFLDKFDERVHSFESLIFYIEKRLYEHTNNYTGSLNRHSILHGFSTTYSTPENFYRMLNLLNSLAFCASFAENISISARPANTTEQINLIRHLKLLNDFGLIRHKNLRNIQKEP